VPRRLISLLIATIVVASCGTTDSAATINGSDILTTDLEQTITDFVTIGEAASTNGVVDAETVRSLLTSLIRAEATNQVIAAAGEEVTDEDLASVREQLAEQGTEDLPESLRELIVQLNAAQAVLGRVKAPSPQDIAERYNSNPKSLGMLCVSHLVVDDESTAKTARAELDDKPTDAQFAEVAGKYSIEPNAKESGGALTGQSGTCISIKMAGGFRPRLRCRSTCRSYRHTHAAREVQLRLARHLHPSIHRSVRERVGEHHLGTR